MLSFILILFRFLSFLYIINHAEWSVAPNRFCQSCIKLCVPTALTKTNRCLKKKSRVFNEGSSRLRLTADRLDKLGVKMFQREWATVYWCQKVSTLSFRLCSPHCTIRKHVCPLPLSLQSTAKDGWTTGRPKGSARLAWPLEGAMLIRHYPWAAMVHTPPVICQGRYMYLSWLVLDFRVGVLSERSSSFAVAAVCRGFVSLCNVLWERTVASHVVYIFSPT